MKPWLVDERTAGPSTALPRISCGAWWRCRTSCAFLHGKAHTRSCPVQRGRKSGFASVGMTILLDTAGLVAEQKAFFITLGGPKAHDNSGRDDKFVWEGPVLSSNKFVISTGA
jgi:hypothetical protein